MRYWAASITVIAYLREPTPSRRRMATLTMRLSPLECCRRSQWVEFADHYILDQCSFERGLRQQLHGCGDCQFGSDGSVHQLRLLHELGRDLHHDQEHGNLLCDRQPGGQQQQRACA